MNISEASKTFYENNLKAKLEPSENGKFVAIEPESETFFIGDTALEAIKKGRAKSSNQMFFLIRVGFPTAYKIGGYGKRSRQS